MAEAESAFEAGKQAAIDGKGTEANPYSPGSEAFEQWKAGFEFVDTYDEDGEIPSDG